MQEQAENKCFHIEILTPKQDTDDLDGALEKFADKYQRTIAGGHVASITDNPMGMLSFQATEVISELELPVETDYVLVHLNTFHTKEHLHEILDSAGNLGLTNLLVISGDGSPRIPKLEPEDIGATTNTVTSVELMRYIKQSYPGAFRTGVAYNPYEPREHEDAKMARKIDAGAEFIITQPVVGHHEAVDTLGRFGVTVILDAWMSKKLHLLSECVGYEILEDTPYDPIANLRELHAHYPSYGLYLALLGFKTQFPQLQQMLD